MGINLAVPYNLVKPEHIHFVYNRVDRVNFIKAVYSMQHTVMNNCTIMIWNCEPIVYMSLYYIVYNIQSHIVHNLKHLSAFADYKLAPMVDMVMCFVMNLYKKYGIRRFFLRIFGINVNNHKMTVSFRVF
tara:strand:+ start:27 stop:416 length:390 start_codon:yes stop_codon:yes gene_type:complete